MLEEVFNCVYTVFNGTKLPTTALSSDTVCCDLYLHSDLPNTYAIYISIKYSQFY